MNQTATHPADPHLMLTAASLLNAAGAADAERLAEIFERHHDIAAVVATAFRWTVRIASMHIPFDFTGRPPAYSHARTERLVNALARNAVAGVDVPRALRASLRATAQRWEATEGALVLVGDDVTDPEALSEIVTVAVDLVITAAERMDVTVEAYLSGAEQFAISALFKTSLT